MTTTTTRASCFDQSYFSRNFGFVSVFFSKIMHLILLLVLKSLANSRNAFTICIFVVSLYFSLSHIHKKKKKEEKNKKNLKHKISQIKQNLSQYANLMQMLCIFKSLVNFLNIYIFIINNYYTHKNILILYIITIVAIYYNVISLYYPIVFICTLHNKLYTRKSHRDLAKLSYVLYYCIYRERGYPLQNIPYKSYILIEETVGKIAQKHESNFHEIIKLEMNRKTVN